MDRFDEVIDRFKEKLFEKTDIKNFPDEMKVLDKILFRFWQMGWLNIIEEKEPVFKMAKEIHEIWYDYFKQDPMDRL